MSYDIENGLRVLAEARAEGGALLLHIAGLADKVAAHIREDFASSLDMETVGKALVIAASAVVPLCTPDIPSTVITVDGMSGENLVREARNGR